MSEPRSRTTIYIRDEIKKKGRILAIERNRSLSNLIEDLIDKAIREESDRA